MAKKIKEDVIKDFPETVVRYNYREDIISDMIRAKIRKAIMKETGIKPVTFMHFYRRQSEKAILPDVKEDKQ